MRTVTAEQLKEQCQSMIDAVCEHDEEVVVIKDGKPVARLVCADPTRAQRGVTGRALLGRLRGKLNIQGDIFSTGLKWNAES